MYFFTMKYEIKDYITPYDLALASMNPECRNFALALKAINTTKVTSNENESKTESSNTNESPNQLNSVATSTTVVPTQALSKGKNKNKDIFPF